MNGSVTFFMLCVILTEKGREWETMAWWWPGAAIKSITILPRERTRELSICYYCCVYKWLQQRCRDVSILHFPSVLLSLFYLVAITVVAARSGGAVGVVSLRQPRSVGMMDGSVWCVRVCRHCCNISFTTRLGERPRPQQEMACRFATVTRSTCVERPCEAVTWLSLRHCDGAPLASSVHTIPLPKLGDFSPHVSVMSNCNTRPLSPRACLTAVVSPMRSTVRIIEMDHRVARWDIKETSCHSPLLLLPRSSFPRLSRARPALIDIGTAAAAFRRSHSTGLRGRGRPCASRRSLLARSCRTSRSRSKSASCATCIVFHETRNIINRTPKTRQVVTVLHCTIWNLYTHHCTVKTAPAKHS